MNTNDYAKIMDDVTKYKKVHKLGDELDYTIYALDKLGYLTVRLTKRATDGGWWCACGWPNHDDETECSRPSCSRPAADANRWADCSTERRKNVVNSHY